MIDVPTVAIGDLAETATLEGALAVWRGFVPLLPAARPPAGRPFLQLGAEGPARWHWTAYEMPAAVGPLGARFLRNVELCGSGYLFSAGRFIREFSHTSDVGLDWLRREDFPDNPFVLPPHPVRAVDEPALLVIGPGFPIWGHWLLDFLPRVALARMLLGGDFGRFRIPLPADAPDWLPAMLRFFCDVPETQLLRFDRLGERLLCRLACIPSFCHDGRYVLHAAVAAFYDRFIPAGGCAGRRLCLSRRNFETGTRGAWRVFESRAAFERMAVAHGYEIVCPEELGLTEQIALFADAAAIVGEHGSGMHSAIFSGRGTAVGCIGLSNAIQFLIGAERGHTNVYLDRIETRTDERGVVFYDVDPALLDGFFRVMDLVSGDIRA